MVIVTDNEIRDVLRRDNSLKRRRMRFCFERTTSRMGLVR